MREMKRIFCVLACTAAALCGADLAEVRAVYVMPMSRGIDQYLANRLTTERVFKIVSDPKLADAVFTDRLGDDLTSSLNEISPQKAAAAKTDSTDSAAPLNRLDNPAAGSSFGRAQGVFFLVDAKTREVVWSTFEAPGRLDSMHMDRTASDIVSRLKRDLKEPASAKQPAEKQKTPKEQAPKQPAAK